MVKFLRDPAQTGGVADPEATDVDRRAQDVVKFGRVKKVDYKRQPPAYRIEFGDENDEDNYILTDWLPATGMRAKGDRETHYLEEGEKVAVLAEGGELATAYVMPAGQYTEQEDEKETTDKAGVWRKVFQKPKQSGGQSDDGAQGGGSGDSNQGSEILGEISYDREKGDWLIKGIKDKGSITIEGSGCSIVMKDGKITLKAKTVTIEAEDKFESKTDKSHHTALTEFKTAGKGKGKTILGLDDIEEKIDIKVSTEAGPAKSTIAKPG
ncbi:phage baseplate assembly protein V [Rhodopseudomonas palustris]|uniref:phage baseplate assembly protein V n=1 Tax=Rhodopseudomonas palustris TaxID=1076 RepID=UPI0006426496|nr:phage baseplate assembly protein V [Rhodopseudomonas palustris]